MRRVAFLLIGLVGVLLLVGYQVSNRSQMSPEDEISAVLERGRQGIEKKQIRQVFSCVSRDYADSGGMNRDRMRLLIGNAFTSDAGFQVTMDVPSTEVQGESAIATTHVTVKCAQGDGSVDQVFKGDVVLHLRKEKARKYLLLPTQIWRITSTDGIKGISYLDQ